MSRSVSSYPWITGVETVKTAIQSTVRECGLRLQSRVNDGPVCDAQRCWSVEAAYALRPIRPNW